MCSNLVHFENISNFSIIETIGSAQYNVCHYDSYGKICKTVEKILNLIIKKVEDLVDRNYVKTWMCKSVTGTTN